MIEHTVVRARKFLIVGLRNSICAVPLPRVIETMRPLPLEPVFGLPSFVQGISIIRGIPTPVVDLGAVLGMESDLVGRFVTMRVADKQVALSVNTVIGVRDLDASVTNKGLPPLLQRASKDVVTMIGMLDKQVLMVFEEGWELPDEVWQALTAQGAVS